MNTLLSYIFNNINYIFSFSFLHRKENNLTCRPLKSCLTPHKIRKGIATPVKLWPPRLAVGIIRFGTNALKDVRYMYVYMYEKAKSSAL